MAGIPAAAGLRHAEHVMGTVFSFDVRGDITAGAFSEVLAWLHWVDATFSTYRPDSEISRLGRGELRAADCPPEVAEVLAVCTEMNQVSGGYFTATPGGRLDPSAVVKGWAVERASDMLRAAGSHCHSVNGGGDIQLAGEAAPGRHWRIGITHPLRPGTLATIVAGRDLAVATSGVAERGTHIVDPHTGRPATELASITVVGPRLTMADAYATAAFAMGEAARDWIESLDGHEAYAVTAGERTWWTSGFPRYGPTVASLADVRLPLSDSRRLTAPH